MSTIENYLLTVSALHTRMWAQAKPLEKRLRDLDTEYQAASRRPITDVVSRGAAAILLTQINATTGQLNAVYDDWQRTLSLMTPPPPTIDPNTFPPPRTRVNCPPESRGRRTSQPRSNAQLGRIIDQGGIPVSKRVAVTVARAPYGGSGVVVEFAKW